VWVSEDPDDDPALEVDGQPVSYRLMGVYPYLAGMWTNPPGGIPGAASARRQVVQLLCHADHKRFGTTTIWNNCA